MKIKELTWEDNITEIGKAKGMFEIVANVIFLHSWLCKYTIRNWKFYGDEPSDKTFMFININDKEIIECDSIDDAKEKAQEHFKNLIIKNFFENKDSNDILLIEDIRNKLGPIKNLIKLVEKAYSTDDNLSELIAKEIEQCKETLKYLNVIFFVMIVGI